VLQDNTAPQPSSHHLRWHQPSLLPSALKRWKQALNLIKNLESSLTGNFFQNNNFFLSLMVDSVHEALAQPTAFVIDCHWGSGLFALSAASKMKVCVGIELDQRAIEEATVNAQLNGWA
jgi:tRNA/tmRNA/rRNA uracil-C5-methylase (TrmA/RlmC/RlmD family)